MLWIALLDVGLPTGRADDLVVHNFSTTEGAPAIYGSLVLEQGVLYGMTSNGGSQSVGTIFRVNVDGSGYAAIHNFTNDGNISDGASPLSSLTLAGSVLYGMTPAGGIAPPVGPFANSGTVFRINTDGTGFQVLHGFTGGQLAASNDGGMPYGAVTVSDSKLYGMTRFGGTSTRGTIFSLNTDGTGFQVLHSFTEAADDGALPEGSLTLVGSTLYGLTNSGGGNDTGTIFRINTDGSDFTVLHSFGDFNSGEAMEPMGGNGLTLTGSTLYGVTYNGGAAQNGAIFSINIDGSGFQMLHSFNGNDGAGPYGSLVESGTQLYGTTSGFGATVANGTGTVFGVSLDGTAFTLLQTFAGGPDDGLLAVGTLAISADASLLYGMTQYGGAVENGTLFSVIASGSLTNANLFSLAPSAGALDSVFDGANTRYTVYVSDGVTAITVTPTPVDTGATITVNGSPVAAGAPSFPISLNTGSNIIDTIVTARDGVTTNLYTLTVIRLTNLQNWRWNFLGTPADAGSAANSADFNGNGIPNLVKYAFGLDPTSSSANQVPKPSVTAGNVGLNFNQPPGVSGIGYGAEWTPSLNPPNWIPLPDTGSGSMHNFQVFVGTLPSAFMRLKVTVPLSPIEQLGKDIFFDNSLSNPTGLSCAGCHSPSTGFTGPSSAINLSTGPMPGAVAGRAGFRKPQAIAYSAFSPSGPYFDNGQQLWSGGNFWDGHAPTNAGQALFPFIGPNEMANTAVGPYPPVHGGYSPDVVHALSQASYAPLFQQVFGPSVFRAGNEANVYPLAAQAIAAYEASEEVNPFTAKYDASVNATPPSDLYQFTASEENGRQLFFGKAQCFACHSSAPLNSVSSVTLDREVFTMYCFANIGTPPNPNNPFYAETDPTNNPLGYNPQGTAFIDYGLGANPNPSPAGTRFMNRAAGDIAEFRGLFKAPSLRNVDKRPSPDFVKSYTHNGVFKSLEEIVHFYNKRNIAVNTAGDEVAFDLRIGPPAGYTRLFPAPEVLDNVQNVAGLTPAETRQGEADVATNGQIGHLQLTADEEADLVNFLKTLTDGFIGSPGQ